MRFTVILNRIVHFRFKLEQKVAKETRLIFSYSKVKMGNISRLKQAILQGRFNGKYGTESFRKILYGGGAHSQGEPSYSFVSINHYCSTIQYGDTPKNNRRMCFLLHLLNEEIASRRMQRYLSKSKDLRRRYPEIIEFERQFE